MPHLTEIEIAEACKQVNEFLTRYHINSKDIIRFQINLEEVLLYYKAHLDSETVFKLKMGKRFGKIKILLLVNGAMLDPFAPKEELDFIEKYMHDAILNMGNLPVWHYEHGHNIVVFSLSKKKMPEWAQLITAIASATLLGLLIRIAPDSTRILFQETIVAPLIKTFLGFLNAISGPMIFLSVVWGIYSVGDASTFSIMGKKLAKRYAFSLILMLLLSAVASAPFFHLNFSETAKEAQGFSALYQMVLDVIPTNMFTPFSQGNTLQIMFIAIIVGITMIIIGEKSELVGSLAEQLNYIINSIMSFVAGLVPFFVFCSLFNIIVSSDVSILLNASKFFFGAVGAYCLIIVCHTAITCFYNHISPVQLWKRSFSTFMIGLTTASSSAAFADNMSTCINKHGINPTLVNFAVPFGQILYRPGTAVIYWFAAISVAESTNCPVSATWIIVLLVMCFVLSFATPPITGGTTASLSILFTQLGLPMDNMSIILALNVIQEFFRTATNLFAGQCILLDASKAFGLNEKMGKNL